MRYRRVCLESVAYTLPDEIVSSDELEARLEPLYSRLRLPAGRLELMTGIRERRFWAPGALPSEQSIETGRKALAASGIDPMLVGALIHGSVCRDHLEPATASAVHHGLGLGENCVIYDVSNACLGLMNGLLQAANMIELGQTRAALVVGSEGGRQLVETTIDWLNRDETLTRAQVKLAVASLTIGSASAALLLVDRERSRTGHRLIGAHVGAYTAHHRLCHSGADEAAAHGMRPLMTTDSERLLMAGIAAGKATLAGFLRETGWQPEEIEQTICHQVGSAHRKLLLAELGLDPERDFATYPTLGNTGAAALPSALALADEAGRLKPGDRVALLGIGSGINVVMAGLEWGGA
jgi:3-oxoacyl-[acyl-carrier-protein] synthase-3